MGTVLGLGGMAMAGATAVAVLGAVWVVLKLVFLPIRLALGLVKLVVGLVGGLLGMLALVALAPLLLIAVGGALVVGLGVALLAVALPLLPFILIGVLVWSFLKRPAVAA
jgi:hypothetical protein